jgi:hypothetical protein
MVLINCCVKFLKRNKVAWSGLGENTGSSDEIPKICEGLQQNGETKK